MASEVGSRKTEPRFHFYTEGGGSDGSKHTMTQFACHPPHRYLLGMSEKEEDDEEAPPQQQQQQQQLMGEEAEDEDDTVLYEEYMQRAREAKQRGGDRLMARKWRRRARAVCPKNETDEEEDEEEDGDINTVCAPEIIYQLDGMLMVPNCSQSSMSATRRLSSRADSKSHGNSTTNCTHISAKASNGCGVCINKRPVESWAMTWGVSKR